MSDERDPIPQQVRAMQIIVFALAMGVVTFALVLLLVIGPGEREEAPGKEFEPIISYVGLAVAGGCAVVGVVLPRVLARQMPATAETYQTTLIIGAALFESPAFLNLTAYMLEGQAFSLAVAGVMLVFILLLFPTVGRVREWLETRQRREEEQRAFNR